MGFALCFPSPLSAVFPEIAQENPHLSCAALLISWQSHLLLFLRSLRTAAAAADARWLGHHHSRDAHCGCYSECNGGYHQHVSKKIHEKTAFLVAFIRLKQEIQFEGALYRKIRTAADAFWMPSEFWLPACWHRCWGCLTRSEWYWNHHSLTPLPLPLHIFHRLSQSALQFDPTRSHFFQE